ncbi:MAG: hypothetical protein LBJ24_02925 [Treponema sp.]|jgi:hypothetical protein|nr:hypothetical protein [Treponema sp.]
MMRTEGAVFLRNIPENAELGTVLALSHIILNRHLFQKEFVLFPAANRRFAPLRAKGPAYTPALSFKEDYHEEVYGMGSGPFHPRAGRLPEPRERPGSRQHR